MRRALPALVLASGLAAYAVLAVSSLDQDSAVFDEVAHLPAGYTYLRMRDYRLNPEHPPLVKTLAAAPLLLADVRVETAGERSWVRRRQWDFGRKFLYEWNDGDRLLFLGRLPIVALGMATALAVFLWTRRHWGLPAASLALLLCALSPDVLAHGRLVTTDMGIALFVFLTVVAFERLTARATWPRLLGAGAAAGAALATKFSAVVLAPVLVALAAAAVLAPDPMIRAFGPERAIDARGARVRHVAGLLAALALLAWGCVWAAYGFEGRLARDAEVQAAFDWENVRPRPPAVATSAELVRRAGVLPDAYVYGFLRFFKHSERRRAFLLGELSDDGWWYYFPVTFALKTPLGLVALLAPAMALSVRRARAGSWRLEAFVWAPVAIYAAIVMGRSLNIGHRHLLPIYPFLFVAAGRCAALAWPPRLDSARGVAAAALVAGSAVWYAGSALGIHPHYLAYFNELAGGPAHGYRKLVDSSLDWGQGLKGLAAWMRANRIDRIKLSYMGMAPPEYYGIAGERLPGYPPPPEPVGTIEPGDLVAVSATNLQGVYLDPEDRGFVRRLRRQEPIATIGYSILIYRADFAWSREP